MTGIDKLKNYEKIKESLKIDCEKCFGFCCVALYFSKTEGFPIDKIAGKPCINLKGDFKCSVHKNLKEKGLKGCIHYDCFGAGQKVAQIIYKGQDWKNNKENSKNMFDVFLNIYKLHEMLWYLTEAFRIQPDEKMKKEIIDMINYTDKLTRLDSESIMQIDIVIHRSKINKLLLKTSEMLRGKVEKDKKNTLKKKLIAGRVNFMGKDLKKSNLRGENLSGAFLIAADLRGVDLSFTDLIGADLRDADIRGADLSNSIFLTQAQINSAKGDRDTKLPTSLVRPSSW